LSPPLSVSWSACLAREGLYLAIATIAASFILHFLFANGPAFLGGTQGLSMPPARLFGYDLARPFQLYWLFMPLTALAVFAAANLFRTRIGRAFIAIRDRDISAEVLGIPLLKYKLLSFALSSFYAGVAGGMWAYFFRVVTPESFPLIYSVFFSPPSSSAAWARSSVRSSARSS
jgi:branched-chain amino acid transport system permease protein